MLEIQGAYNTALCYTGELEKSAAEQIKAVCDQQAFAALSMDEYRAEMDGIFTTCVVPNTLDESPMAYKSLAEIVAQIGPTATIIERIRPVYNFKASE